jgi:hypothetical protein
MSQIAHLPTKGYCSRFKMGIAGQSFAKDGCVNSAQRAKPCRRPKMLARFG